MVRRGRSKGGDHQYDSGSDYDDDDDFGNGGRSHPKDKDGLFSRMKSNLRKSKSPTRSSPTSSPQHGHLKKKKSSKKKLKDDSQRKQRATTSQRMKDNSNKSDRSDRSTSYRGNSQGRSYHYGNKDKDEYEPPRMPSMGVLADKSDFFNETSRHLGGGSAYITGASSSGTGGAAGAANQGDRKGSILFQGDTKAVYGQTLAAVSDIEQLAQKKGAQHNERFKVMPDDAYPNTFFNREELRTEMNKKSVYFHDTRLPNKRGQELGQLRLEILQCFGIPTSSLVRETQAYCVAVCGSHAFKTDVMPPVANPMWLCRMRRACLFPIHQAYARLFVGCFDDYNSTTGSSTSDFAGRIVLDIARLRPDCTYDITLPLRQSSHIFTREHFGSIRLRFHLQWNNERAAILSYIPKRKPKFQPNEAAIVNCLDDRSFKNVAQVVHGVHMPGKFSMTLLKATIREINFTRIHLFRYMKKREIYNLKHWVYPFISGFVFIAWMHCVYTNSVSYVPGHFITFLLLHMYKNYAYYSMDSPLNNGFMPPTIEELFAAIFRPKRRKGSKRSHSIEPLNMEMDQSHAVNPLEHMDAQDDYEEANPEHVPIHEIAESMRKSLRVKNHTYRLTTYRDCFLGTDAVDFLVTYGFAYSREEAVELGRKLAREVKLFQHVARKHDFEDKPYYYVFLEYDTKKYVIKGHNVWGKKLFKTIGFIQDDPINEEEGHVEFPFATGKDHPRFTVKQSLVIRSSEAKKLLKQQELEKDAADCAEFGVVTLSANVNDNEKEEGGDGGGGGAAGGGEGDLRSSLTHKQKAKRPSALILDDDINAVPAFPVNEHEKFEYDSDDDVDDIKKNNQKGYIVEEKILKKPPNQDMQAKKKGGDKSFTKVLEDARHKLHGVLLHMFNDRVYKIDDKLYPTTDKPNKDKDKDGEVRPSLHTSKSKKKGLKQTISNPLSKKEEKKKKKERAKMGPYDLRKDEYDKLLQINKYSHSNPWINRVAVIVQPIVEMVQEFLCLFRSLFNIFTWQDPIMSFWIAILGPIVVLFLHLAPWRYLLGIAGLLFVGPQNYAMRLYRESRPDYEPPDFDKIIKKKKPPKEQAQEDLPYFSSESPGNRLLLYKNIDPHMIRHVVVPYGQMKYQRFYDWPPEPEYARVYASPAPRNDFGDGEDGENFMYENAYWFDPTLSRKETKKQKEGMKKFASQAAKSSNKVLSGVGHVGETAFKGARTGTTRVVGGTAKVTKKATMGMAKGVAKGAVGTAGVVKGAGQATAGVAKGAASLTAGAVKNTAGFTTGAVMGATKATAGAVTGVLGLGLRQRKQASKREGMSSEEFDSHHQRSDSEDEE